jgi:FlaA1/EpsC-like NDP-sugar epimerase
VHLTLLAAVQGKGGETFVLDMGEPVKILDIAKDIISSYGLVPDRDIHIEYTGLNRGERLIEHVISTEEEVVRTKFNKVLMVKAKKDDERSKEDQGKGEHEAV